MRKTERIVDDLLVLRGQAGDPQAIDLLVRRWHPKMLRHATRLAGNAEAAHEIVQESWIGAVRGLSRLDDPGRFPGWILRIVGNKCRDWIRREQRRRHRREVARQLARDAPPTPSDESDRREDALRRLRAGLSDLPDDRRTLLSMFYLEQLSVQQIAEALSIPRGTVKSRLFHARNHLRNLLEEP